MIADPSRKPAMATLVELAAAGEEGLLMRWLAFCVVLCGSGAMKTDENRRSQFRLFKYFVFARRIEGSYKRYTWTARRLYGTRYVT